MSVHLIREHEHEVAKLLAQELEIELTHLTTFPDEPEPKFQAWSPDSRATAVLIADVCNGTEARVAVEQLDLDRFDLVLFTSCSFPFDLHVPTRLSKNGPRGINPWDGSPTANGALRGFRWDKPTSTNPTVWEYACELAETQPDFELHRVEIGFGLGVLIRSSALTKPAQPLIAEATRTSQLRQSRRAVRLALVNDAGEQTRARLQKRVQTQARQLQEASGLLWGPSGTYEAPSVDWQSQSPEEHGAGGPRLSIVVIGYNMNREVPRSIASCLPPYQQGVGAGMVEVICVDNASPDPIVLPDALARHSHVKLIRLESTQASLAHAINTGVDAASAPNVAVMIDGAHMLSPGVVRWSLHALDTYANPVVIAPRFQLGELQQRDSFLRGYDQSVEDELLESINWPQDGYRLFDIAVFIGDSPTRTWTSSLVETSFLAMSRDRFIEMGGADEQFVDPAGGLLNLELLRRAVEDLSTTYVSLIGEASFHQFHGGTTSNVSRSSRDEKLSSYHAEYEQIFGKPYTESARRPVFVGSAQPNAMQAHAFARDVRKATRQAGANVMSKIVQESQRIVDKADEA